jgi:cytoskeletal protein RodZ
MKEFKDPAIREMLRRRHAAVPPLSDSFEEKLLAAYERQQRQHKMRRLILWPSIAAAATVALLLTLHFTRQPVSESQMAQVPTPSVNIISSPKEPISPTPSLSEASSKEKHKTHRKTSRVITQEEVTDNSIATASEEKTEEHNIAVASNNKPESIEMTKASDAKPNKEVEPALFNHNRYKVRSHIAAAFNMLQSTSEI